MKIQRIKKINYKSIQMKNGNFRHQIIVSDTIGAINALIDAQEALEKRVGELEPHFPKKIQWNYVLPKPQNTEYCVCKKPHPVGDPSRVVCMYCQKPLKENTELREKIKMLIYGTRASTTLTPEQEDWANKTVDAILRLLKEEL